MKTTSFTVRAAIKNRFLPLGMLVALAGVAASQSLAAEELRTAAQVRSLSPQQAAQELPVKLKGVVTFCDERLNSRFVQDDTAGVYFFNLRSNMPALTAGQLVEIEGVTGPGAYAPIIIPRSINVAGEGKWPDAKAATGQQLLSGQEDSQFVQVRGIVRSVRLDQATKQYQVALMVDGERLTAYAPQLPVAQPEELVDSVVKAQGVCSTLFNPRRQLAGVQLLAPRASDLVVERPAPGNPFEASAQDVSSLLQFAPQGNFGHRVKLRGTVAYAESGDAVFIQNEKGGVYCQTKLRTPLRLGTQVEVLGFPAKGEYTPILEDAIYRKVGDGDPPAPVTLALDEILSGTNDCRLIRTDARIIERTQRGREKFLVLQQNGFTFNAYLGQDENGVGLEGLKSGSDVSATGICLMERGSGWHGGEDLRAKSFRLLLRSPADVVVHGAPSIWAQLDPRLILSVLLAVIVLMFLWVFTLSRRIKKAPIRLA